MIDTNPRGIILGRNIPKSPRRAAINPNLGIINNAARRIVGGPITARKPVIALRPFISYGIGRGTGAEEKQIRGAPGVVSVVSVKNPEPAPPFE